MHRPISARTMLTLCLLTAGLCAGCRGSRPTAEAYAQPAPRELQKVSLPTYVVEPPDILLIDAQRIIPLPSYRLEPLDALYVSVPAAQALPTAPLEGVFAIELDGTLNLGPSYGGPIRVADLTLDEARAAIEGRLRKVIKDFKLTVSLAQTRALTQIRGDHLIRPDGTIGLGTYGSVYVAGMTLADVKAAVEQHLSKFAYRPEVSVDVYAYNSKVYYVITDGGGYGEQVVRIPSYGNETVLDAISQVYGLSTVASKERIWVARPSPPGCGNDQVLPVDWEGITRCGRTATNYQILPGDRIYVMAKPLVTLDTALARFLNPIERVFGGMLLGNSTVQSIRFGGAGGGFGGFGGIR